MVALAVMMRCSLPKASGEVDLPRDLGPVAIAAAVGTPEEAWEADALEHGMVVFLWFS